ncbi:MAG: alpha/beta fold hydrolase [Bdellovibrionales bacterium]|nr:alpha/beta fold hydrolase [Bdellovibrionales bacterium]
MIQVASFRGLNTAWIAREPAGGAASDRPLLLFLHGFPDAPESWEPQLELFSKEYPVIAPYLRGLEPSAPGASSRCSREAVADDVVDILNHAPEARAGGVSRPVIVIGHDIGGMHAWHLARRLGPRLRGLVVLNGPSLEQMAARITWPRQVVRSWYIFLFQVPLLAERIFRQFQGGTGTPTPGRAVEPLIEHYRQAAREMPRALIRRPPKLEAPVLCIWSAHDRFLEIPTRAELERQAEDFELHVVKGNHWVHHRHPERVNPLLEKFFAGKPRRRRAPQEIHP